MTLIALEGLDFSGKTSALNQALPFLISSYPNIITTHEPGGTPLGEEIRHTLLTKGQSMSGSKKLELFEEARIEHVSQIIEPAIHNNKIVITDRYIGSTYAYQVGGDHVPVFRVNQGVEKLFATYPNARPSLTIYFKVSSEVRQRRLSMKDHDALDNYDDKFYQEVEHEYLKGIDKISDNVAIIDANQALPQVAQQLESVIREYLAGSGEYANN